MLYSREPSQNVNLLISEARMVRLDSFWSGIYSPSNVNPGLINL